MKDFDFSANIFFEKLEAWLLSVRPRFLSFRFTSFQKPLIVCFFVSGACGLIYEICWLRMMGLIFGNTTFATSTVLAGYMAGLGFGAFFGGKWISAKASVKIYALLEAGVGLYALLTPAIWKLIDALNVVFYQLFAPSFFTAILFKFVVVFIALLIPTFLMGATLPALASFFVHKKNETARGVGLLYALNTFGAVFGVLFSAFFALHALGVWQTVFLTAILNLFIFGLLFYSEVISQPPSLSVQTGSVNPHVFEDVSDLTTVPAGVLLFCFALSGAVSMMYEIGWTRILAMSLGSSVYAFSIMLATFLLGIALGSYFFSLAAKRLKIDLVVFSFLQIFTGLFALMSMNFFNDMPYYFVQLFKISQGTGLKFEFGKFILAGTVMLPPTLLIGAMFACFIHIYRKFQPLGSEIGQAYFTNTIGTIFGSVLTGFVLIPLIGIRNTLLAAAVINITIGALLIFLGRKELQGVYRIVAVVGMFGLVAWGLLHVQPWNVNVIASDIAVKPLQRVGMSKKDLIYSLGEREILFYKEGTNAIVTVAKSRDNLSLAVNGKVDASNADTFTQFLLGHLPMMLHRDPRNVLVIGVGSGSTMAAVASYPIEKIDAVELEPAVVQGARLFHQLNRNVLDDPRVHIHVNDGRNFARVTQNTYDVIISEPSNPWMAGVANLFSYEHYQSMGRKLNSGGIVCQWLHGYSMSAEDLRMIIKTFTQSYKHTMLWTSYYPDMMLIGSNDPLTIDFDRVRTAFEIPQVKADLSAHGLTAPEGLLASFWLGDGDLRRASEGAKMNQDNFPRLEFSAPYSLYKDTVLENFVMLDSYRTIDFPEVSHVPFPPEKSIIFRKALIRGTIASKMYRKAARVLNESKSMFPGDPELLLLEGLLVLRVGDAHVASDILTQAVTELPLSAEAYYYLGQALAAQNKLPEAGKQFEMAVGLDRSNLNYLFALANHLAKMGKFQDALPFFDKLTKEKDEPFDAWVQKVFILSIIGSSIEFGAAAEQFVSLYPAFPQGYEFLAMAFTKQGEIESAIENYKKAIKLQPEKADLFLKLAELSEKLGRLPDVAKYVRKAIDINPELAKNSQLKAISEQATMSVHDMVTA